MASPLLHKPNYSNPSANAGVITLEVELIATYLMVALIFWFIYVLVNLFRLYPAIRSKYWNQKHADILDFKVNKESDENRVYYSVKIRYQFCIDGAVYEGSNFSYRIHRFVSESSIEKHMLPYLSGEKLLISYNSRNPSSNVMEVGLRKEDLVMLILLLPLFLFVAFIIGASVLNN